MTTKSLFNPKASCENNVLLKTIVKFSFMLMGTEVESLLIEKTGMSSKVKGFFT